LSFIRFIIKEKKINKILSKILPKNTCIDVGASYFEHTNWSIFLNSPNTDWICTEPNIKNLEYTKYWHWKSKIIKLDNPLWSENTKKNFYITNGDTGSSLLKPKINENCRVRYKYIKTNNLFPLKKKTVSTITLDKLTRKKTTPIFLKIDTQGSELEILKGAKDLLKKKKILGLEVESSLLYTPINFRGCKFWEITKFIESYGYELIYLKKHYVESYFENKVSSKRIPNECDAVFLLNQKDIYRLDIQKKILVLSFFISYNLIEEAIIFVENSPELKKYFDKKKYKYSTILKLLKNQ
jgi:FkbM family methyltransferase